jgi:hypothetical protein
MKAETFNYKGYKFSVIGVSPTGNCMTNCLKHIDFLCTSKGAFDMQVIENGWRGTISKISFKKLK